MEQTTQLKKPIGIFILAILFILAPLGNLLISFAGSGVEGWYQPSIMIGFIKTVSKLDWVWLGLLVVTGVLLLRPHKTTWSLAIVTLVLVLCMNLYRATSGEMGDSSFVHWHLGASVLVTLSGLILTFYFRFPYLDRRSRWLFSTAHRLEVRTPVQIVADNIFEGVTESLSASGARVRLQRDIGAKPSELRFVDVIFKEIKNMKTKAMVVEYDENILRLKFKELSSKDRTTLVEWIESQNKTNRG